ncbi:MAG: uracil-DNA glycosylase [Anaplasma sp.]
MNEKGCIVVESSGDAELLEVLKFYHESGVDCILKDYVQDAQDGGSVCGEETVEYSAALQPAVVENVPEPVVKPGKKQFSTDWIDAAQRIAEACHSLAELREAVESFEGCDIKKSSMNTVLADGNPNAKIMLIGEAPGSSEDREGRPFCGASGKLLDKMLAAIDLSRENTYISNTIFWRPPGNRRPTDFELAVCRPFVEKHIALVAPDIIVLVGGTACYALLDVPESVSKLRGRFHKYTNSFLERPITTAVIFHPAYLLRQPMQKRLAWEDLKLIRAYIERGKVKIDF